MPIPVGNTVRIAYFATLFGQRIMSVFHYEVTANLSSNSLLADLQIIAGTFSNSVVAGTPIKALLPLTTAQMQWDYVRAQVVSPAMTVYRQALIGQPGTHAGQTLMPNDAMSITKKSELFGRRGIGHIQLAGVPSEQIVAGKFTANYQAEAALNVIDLVLPVNTQAPQITLKHVLFHGIESGVPNSTVQQLIPQDTVRTMHRRTVGLGI